MTERAADRSMLTLVLDNAANAAYIGIGDHSRVDRTYPCDPAETGGQIHLDFDGEGRLVGIEILDADRMLQPQVRGVARQPSYWYRILARIFGDWGRSSPGE
jgi:uncharacterized protein YuzE